VGLSSITANLLQAFWCPGNLRSMRAERTGLIRAIRIPYGIVR